MPQNQFPMKQIKVGDCVIHDHHHAILKATRLETPLGLMVAIADDEELYLLEFVDGRSVEREVEGLTKKLKAVIIPGENRIIKKIMRELTRYFAGEQWVFETPLHLSGTPFQKLVWKELIKIPPGETQSYANIAKSIHKPTAFRAVAGANAANQLAIVIPCHRVINTNGDLGGYAGGITRKQWMLDHERGSQSDSPLHEEKRLATERRKEPKF